MRFRYLYKQLENHLAKKTYTIITGARQVGKTSLLKQLYLYLKKRNEIAVILNLEDTKLLSNLNYDVKSVFKHVPISPKKILDGKTNKRIYLLIDEIQYLNDPSNFLKYLYDEYEYNVKIIATGSSAFYIDHKFKDSLAGRKRIFQLYPLSFNEFMEFKNYEEAKDDLTHMVMEPSYVSQYGTNINSLFYEYLTYGGYPAVILEDDIENKKWILRELRTSYLKKDITDAGIEKEVVFFKLIQLLADQTGNLVNGNELSNTLDTDNKTINKYLYILEKSFHIDLLKPFYGNLRKELIKMPKVYFNDIGMRNALLNRFENPHYRMDKGMLFENFVYNQLRIKYEQEQIKYWRTVDGKEVDFVIEESYKQGIAMEIKWNCKQFKSKKYKKFEETYPNYPLKCIDSDNMEIRAH